MTAVLNRPRVSSRRVSAGIEPAPGATSTLPAWWGSEDWLDEVAGALDERPELLREHHVSRDAVLALARGMAGFADFRTGRDCRPTNAKLVEVLRCSLSTVQRARRVLKDVELVVELIRGRSILTRAERLAAWRRGSSHRNIASTFALCSRPRRAPKVRTTRGARGAYKISAPAHLVDGDTPPGADLVSTSLTSRSSHLRRRTENEERRSAPRTCQGVAGGASRRLAEATKARLPWLRDTSWRRLAPALAKCAREGWTVRDVDLALADVLAVRGHRVPGDLKHPAAYLASLLRDVDPAGMVRPSVEADAHEAWLREQAAAQRAAQRAYVAALRTSCAHGVPAGDVPHPTTGSRACPQCRGSIPR